jgi:uncharacterized protein (DUF1810 family)
MTAATDLQRFVQAQDPVYDRVVMELRLGQKTSHWMWFVFPQIAGLGHSAMSRTYAIADLAEARAYLADPILGPRLRECTILINNVTGRTIHQIFGSPDDFKFHAAMTLFRAAADDDSGAAPFQTAIEMYFDGEPHVPTLERL